MVNTHDNADDDESKSRSNDLECLDDAGGNGDKGEADHGVPDESSHPVGHRVH